MLIVLVPNCVVTKNRSYVLYADLEHLAPREFVDAIVGHFVVDDEKMDRFITYNSENVAIHVEY